MHKSREGQKVLCKSVLRKDLNCSAPVDFRFVPILQKHFSRMQPQDIHNLQISFSSIYILIIV